MNSTFIIKMLKAKKLEYEAIKEIMPNNVRERWEEAESKVQETLKQVAIEYIKEETGRATTNEEDASAKKTKKVHVEF